MRSPRVGRLLRGKFVPTANNALYARAEHFIYPLLSYGV